MLSTTAVSDEFTVGSAYRKTAGSHAQVQLHQNIAWRHFGTEQALATGRRYLHDYLALSTRVGKFQTVGKFAAPATALCHNFTYNKKTLLKREGLQFNMKTESNLQQNEELHPFYREFASLGLLALHGNAGRRSQPICSGYSASKSCG